MIYVKDKHNIVADYFSRNFKSVREWEVTNCFLFELEAFNNSKFIVALSPVFNFSMGKSSKEDVDIYNEKH